MAGFNQAVIFGRVGKDPEYRNLQNGDRVANFSVATSRSWKDKNTGEWKDDTEWHRVAVFNDAKIKYIDGRLSKGDMVLVMGEIKTRKWKDKDGNERYQTEIVVPKFGGDIQFDRKADGNNDSKSGGSSKAAASDTIDDEIPF